MYRNPFPYCLQEQIRKVKQINYLLEKIKNAQISSVYATQQLTNQLQTQNSEFQQTNRELVQTKVEADDSGEENSKLRVGAENKGPGAAQNAC